MTFVDLFTYLLLPSFAFIRHKFVVVERGTRLEEWRKLMRTYTQPPILHQFFFISILVILCEKGILMRLRKEETKVSLRSWNFLFLGSFFYKSKDYF